LVARLGPRDDADMLRDPRTSNVARIGRSYPRPLVQVRPSAPRARVARRYRLAGALIVVLSALGVLGWLLAR
jgi:hypothetical protein